MRLFRSAVWAVLLTSLLLVPTQQQARADNGVLTGGAVVAEANDVIQQLQNLGATWAGDGSILINGTASQLSALLGQLTTALHNDFTVPITSLGYDVQALAKRVDSISKQLNQLLTQQRNCGFDNATALISGIKNAGLLTMANFPLASSGAPRLDYFQFTGHNPEVVPQSGGDVIVYGYRLWVNDAPTSSLSGAAPGDQPVQLKATRGPSNDAVQFTIPGAVLDSHSGQTLTLQIDVHQAKKWWFIRTGTITTNLQMPFAIPLDYVLKFQLSGQIDYRCSAPRNVNLSPVNFDYHNPDCSNKHNVGPNTTSPQLPSGPDITDAQITGWHYVNWPDGHASPNTRNTTNVQPASTQTTISASGWLDTASCTNFGFTQKLNNDTFWQASVVPEVRYTEAVETTSPFVTDTIAATVPTTSDVLSFPTSCGETGVKNMRYTIVPLVNNVPQQPLFSSPFVVGDEKGVSDKQILGPISIEVLWNPQPVGGSTQMQLQVTRPACGY